MKVVKILLIIILIMMPSTSYAKTGQGELKLSKRIMELVMMYMYGAGSKKFTADKKTKNDPLVMVVSEDGNYAWYFYCPAEYRAWGCMDSNTVYRAKKNVKKDLTEFLALHLLKKEKLYGKMVEQK